MNDNSPNKFDKLVESLLASPHYGEKWGRHWLDLVRYAETNGYERDGDKPQAWRYRDYVIKSFNENKPYDQFVTEQLAGDEILNASADAITATGFHRDLEFGMMNRPTEYSPATIIWMILFAPRRRSFLA